MYPFMAPYLILSAYITSGQEPSGIGMGTSQLLLSLLHEKYSHDHTFLQVVMQEPREQALRSRSGIDCFISSTCIRPVLP